MFPCLRNNIKSNSLVTAVIFFLMGLGVFSYLTFMLIYFPLFDFAITDIVWTREWLYMTILDYEMSAICLGAIAIFSEGIFGILWTLGFCLLGSPICCAYVVYRLLFKSLALMDDDYRHLYQDSGGIAMYERRERSDRY